MSQGVHKNEEIRETQSLGSSWRIGVLLTLKLWKPLCVHAVQFSSLEHGVERHILPLAAEKKSKTLPL